MSIGVPPNAGSADEIVAWLLGPQAGSIVDTDGRPLGEHASPLYASVEQREERRVFGDARDATGLPCNVAALTQLHAVWPTLLAGLSAYEARQPETFARTSRRASAGVRLAPLLALRTGQPVPVRAAALYKLTLGFGDVCTAMLLEGRVDADDPSPSCDELDAWLDARPWLIGRTQVCAGSRPQIRRAWLALSTSAPGPGLAELSAPWFGEALTAQLELEALAASAAGAARAALLSGREPGPVCGALFAAARVPLWPEALRQVAGAGPAHASLLFASDAVPPALRAFVAAAQREPPVVLDDALLEAARGPAERLLRALGRAPDAPLTGAAFRDSCSA